jgi:hypothetical protein
MKAFLITATAVAALMLGLSTPAHADALNNLSIAVLPDAQVVPQSISDPCIICATTQAHNPVGFGYNNFDSTGNDTSFNLFSSNITGAFANGDDVTVTPYTGGQLRTFLQSVFDVTLTFGVAVDINTANGGANGNMETLTEFRLIDLDRPLGSRIIFDLTGPIVLPNIRNGNGSADYLITGFDLSSVGVGDRLLFQASWDHATDGGESFYIVPIVQAVDVPEPGSLWMLGSMLSIGGIAGWWQRRRRHGTV